MALCLEAPVLCLYISSITPYKRGFEDRNRLNLRKVLGSRTSRLDLIPFLSLFPGPHSFCPEKGEGKIRKLCSEASSRRSREQQSEACSKDLWGSRRQTASLAPRSGKKRKSRRICCAICGVANMSFGIAFSGRRA